MFQITNLLGITISSKRKSKKLKSLGLWDVITERNHQASFNTIQRKECKVFEPKKRTNPKKYIQDMETNANRKTTKRFAQSDWNEIDDEKMNQLRDMNYDLRKRNAKLVAQNNILKSQMTSYNRAKIIL